MMDLDTKAICTKCGEEHIADTLTDDGLCNGCEYQRKNECSCGSGKTAAWEYDGRGIPLCHVCSDCRKERMSHYRPEILRHYTQADVDEQIEPDDFDVGW